MVTIFFLIAKKVKDAYGLDFSMLRLNAEDELKNEYSTLDEIWGYIGSSHHLDSQVREELKEWFA